MNNGLFGFPVGSNATYKETFFTSSGTFTPMPNTRFVIIETQGAGAAGINGNTSQGGVGGACGQYVYSVFNADNLRPSCTVTIGATSATQNKLVNTGTNQTILTANGGRSGQFVSSFIGPTAGNAFGAGGSNQTGAAAGNPGKHGGFGAGGGGGGGGTDGASTSYAGGNGGKPRSFQFDTTNNIAQGGDGGIGGQTAGTNGTSAVYVSGGFGEGGGGGAGNHNGNGGNGGVGIFGGGGGGGGRGSIAGGSGAAGGTGIMRILEIAYYE